MNHVSALLRRIEQPRLVVPLTLYCFHLLFYDKHAGAYLWRVDLVLLQLVTRTTGLEEGLSEFY